MSFSQSTHPRWGPWFPAWACPTALLCHHGDFMWPHRNPWHWAVCELSLSVHIWSNLLGWWGRVEVEDGVTSINPYLAQSRGCFRRYQAKMLFNPNIYFLSALNILGTGRPSAAPQTSRDLARFPLCPPLCPCPQQRQVFFHVYCPWLPSFKRQCGLMVGTHRIHLWWSGVLVLALAQTDTGATASPPWGVVPSPVRRKRPPSHPTSWG